MAAQDGTLCITEKWIRDRLNLQIDSLGAEIWFYMSSIRVINLGMGLGGWVALTCTVALTLSMLV